MEITLKAVDEVIERTGCTYRQAKDALEKADGDVLDAVILIESMGANTKSTFTNEFSSYQEEKEEKRDADEIINKIKEAIKKGDVDRIVVRDRYDRTITSLSLNTGAIVGTVALLTGAAPLVAITALVAKYGMNYRFVIERNDGSKTVL